MKYPALLLLATLGCSPGLDLLAAESAEIAAAAEEKNLLTPAQLDELLAPIALYPDPLVAIILPAATFPTDVVMAARYLRADGDPEAIDDQPWDDSVKALARYPDVVKWMDENLAWTQQVGAAFLVQPAAVLTGTQRLRAAAIAAGNLKDTPQQTVVVEKEVVRIVPAQREVIYVPVYDPVWVYRPRVVSVYHSSPLITFSVGYRTGAWLSYNCDWGYNTVVVINRPYRTVVWQTYPNWHYSRPVFVEHCHVWRPAPARVHVVRRDYERRSDQRISRPTPNAHVQRSVERRDARPSATVTARPSRNLERNPAAISSTRPDRLDQNRRSQANVGAAPTVSTRPERAQRPERPEQFRRPQVTTGTTPAAPSVVTKPAPSRPRPQQTPTVSNGNLNVRPTTSPAIINQRPVNHPNRLSDARVESTRRPSGSITTPTESPRPSRQRVEQTQNQPFTREPRSSASATRPARDTTVSARPERIRNTPATPLAETDARPSRVRQQ